VFRAFGLGRPTSGPAEVVPGAMGRVFRAETSTGVWAVKELFEHGSHLSAQQLEDQASLVEAAVRAGVAAPGIVRSVNGAIVATVDGVRWRAFEWVDVTGPSSLRQAGLTLARLHATGWPTADGGVRTRPVGLSWAGG
jgi:Ser/Thr protein kinase RdoA (MazF antagonist)